MKITSLLIMLFPVFIYAQSDTGKVQKEVAKKKKNKSFVKQIEQDCCCRDTLTSNCNNDKIKNALPEITVDLKAHVINLPENKDLKRGSAVRIKVINYNPYLYKLNIDNKDSTVTIKNDGKILNWFLDPSNILSLSAGLSGLSITPIFKENIDPNEQASTEVNPDNKKGFVAIKKPNISKTNSDKKVEVAKFSDEEKITKEIIEKYRNQLNSQIDNIVEKNQNIEKDIYTISNSLDFLNELYVPCSKFTNLDETKNTIEQVYEKWRKKVRKQQVEIKKEKDEYLNKMSEYKEQNVTNFKIRVGDSLLTKLYSESIRMLEKMDSALSYTELKKITNTISGIQILKTCYTSLPLYFTSDVKKFSVSLSPWSDNSKLPSYTSSFEIPWQQNSIWGVSAGVYFSTLHNEGYSLSKTPRATDTVYNFISDNPGGGLEFGINAMAYYATRIKNSKNIFIGGSFGTGMSIESKPKPRLFVGPDFIFGDKNRLLLSFGVVAGYVQRLSDLYVGVKDVKTQPVNYMKDYLKAGLYFSLHYSF